ncbi:hypothetical protein GQ42DRAFT_176670 [Ramicandelaber brevisporus]|nr:hypothetical protein GQ42DRAFT_176670 [Ramicandelaber brevisporus]
MRYFSYIIASATALAAVALAGNINQDQADCVKIPEPPKIPNTGVAAVFDARQLCEMANWYRAMMGKPPLMYLECGNSYSQQEVQLMAQRNVQQHLAGEAGPAAYKATCKFDPRATGEIAGYSGFWPDMDSIMWAWYNHKDHRDLLLSNTYTTCSSAYKLSIYKDAGGRCHSWSMDFSAPNAYGWTGKAVRIGMIAPRGYTESACVYPLSNAATADYHYSATSLHSTLNYHYSATRLHSTSNYHYNTTSSYSISNHYYSTSSLHSTSDYRSDYDNNVNNVYNVYNVYNIYNINNIYNAFAIVNFNVHSNFKQILQWRKWQLCLHMHLSKLTFQDI